MEQFSGCTRPYEINRGPYDLETTTELIEVKACRVKTITEKKKNGDPRFRAGRFLINIQAHENLKVLAEEKSKKASYLFVLYQEKDLIRILATKQLSWEATNMILQKMKVFTRKKDEMRYAWTTHTHIFQQERL
jgi:hypothetical protein